MEPELLLFVKIQMVTNKTRKPGPMKHGTRVIAL